MMAKYTYFYYHDILVINDQLGNRSVTNDMENILRTIHLNDAKDLTGYKIIYSDTYGVYDGVKAKNIGTYGNPKYIVEDFIILNTRDQQQAIELIKQQ